MEFLTQFLNKLLSFLSTFFNSLIFFKAVSLQNIQLFNNVGWLTINGAIPKPVEFPIPRFLQICGSNLIAFFGFLFLAT